MPNHSDMLYEAVLQHHVNDNSSLQNMRKQYCVAPEKGFRLVPEQVPDVSPAMRLCQAWTGQHANAAQLLQNGIYLNRAPADAIQ